MNVRLLIDAVVRETTVLIAQLATSGGLRAPLAHVAGQVFLDLAKELEAQGVPKKVSADMFGLALRTYQRKTQRLAQSRTDRGRSLWEAVFEFVGRSGLVTREAIFRRFRHDDEASVRGVLHDLAESGLVFVTGKGTNAAYRAATEEEIGIVRRGADPASTEAFVWSLVYREGPVTLERLIEATKLERGLLEEVLKTLVDAGRVERAESGGIVRYRSYELVLGFDDTAGWEASVEDHFAAMARTITRKLRLDPKASRGDEVGGSTYHFVLWRGHPNEQEVLGELARFRKRMTELRERIDGHNARNPGTQQRLRVDVYYGQSTWQEEEHGSMAAEVGAQDGSQDEIDEVDDES